MKLNAEDIWYPFKEYWRPVKDYEGLYEVSNWGRIKSLNYKNQIGREKLMQMIINRGGYVSIMLSNKVQKRYDVQRLVANAFLVNTDNLPVVHHRNEIKTENWIELDSNGNILNSNLKWVTWAYNTMFGEGGKKVLMGLKKASKQKEKPVLQFSTDGTFIKEYPSITEAEKSTGIWATNITVCCQGKIKTTSKGKYTWRYKKEGDC